MDCNIIKDLIPLYIDGCCSDESAEEIRNHISSCEKCKAVLESMNTSFTSEISFCKTKKTNKVNDWKASVLLSALFLFSFLIITAGVAAEADTSYMDFGNSLAAFNIVVPATGFMLSLANWYFVKLYKSRKGFSRCSCALTVLISLAAFIWSAFHYELNLIDVFSGASFIDIVEGVSFFFGAGIIFTVILTSASKILSDRYAKMLGKE